MSADPQLTQIAPERPGYFGSRRDEIHRELDDRYGAGRWEIRWVVGEELFSRAQAVMLYEDAYYEFLRDNPAVLDQLVREAREVYDDATSNVQSGFDYTAQETNRTHLQDIAIRRAVSRHGMWFRGEELIQIRDSEGTHPLSITLSPGQVPFHRPDLIRSPELEGWWDPSSVESFYQSNKVIAYQVSPG